MKKADRVAKKASNTVMKIISVAISAVLIIISVLALWVLIDKYVIGSPAPRLFGYSLLSVKSGSMSGEIEIDDLIIIKKTDDYEVGEIITYLRDGDRIPTTHRIVGLTSDGRFITKGDANNTTDRFPIDFEEVLGEVVSVKAGAGKSFAWLQTKGWIYIMAFAILLGAASFLLDSKFDNKTASTGEENTEKAEADKNNTEGR